MSMRLYTQNYFIIPNLRDRSDQKQVRGKERNDKVRSNKLDLLRYRDN